MSVSSHIFLSAVIDEAYRSGQRRRVLQEVLLFLLTPPFIRHHLHSGWPDHRRPSRDWSHLEGDLPGA